MYNYEFFKLLLRIINGKADLCISIRKGIRGRKAFFLIKSPYKSYKTMLSHLFKCNEKLCNKLYINTYLILTEIHLKWRQNFHQMYEEQLIIKHV